MSTKAAIRRFFKGGSIPKPVDNSLSARVSQLHFHRDEVQRISSELKLDLDKANADVTEAIGKLTKPV